MIRINHTTTTTTTTTTITHLLSKGNGRDCSPSIMVSHPIVQCNALKSKPPSVVGCDKTTTFFMPPKQKAHVSQEFDHKAQRGEAVDCKKNLEHISVHRYIITSRSPSLPVDSLTRVLKTQNNLNNSEPSSTLAIRVQTWPAGSQPGK